MPRYREDEARAAIGALMREVQALGFCGTSRRYGVTDNAIRKWIRAYERELADAA